MQIILGFELRKEGSRRTWNHSWQVSDGCPPV